MTVEQVEQAIRATQEVMQTVSEWIHKGGCVQDALDDIELHTAVTSFLSTSIGDLPSVASEQPELEEAWKDLEDNRVNLLQVFSTQAQRPIMKSVPVRSSLTAAAAHNFGTEPPQVQGTMPEELVDNLDALASAAFRGLVQDVRLPLASSFDSHLTKLDSGPICYRGYI